MSILLDICTTKEPIGINILNSGFTGWGYMPLLTGLKENGIITYEEYLDICKILD
jgi:hypothetical protein